MGTQGDLSALEKLEQEFEKQKSSGQIKERNPDRIKKGSSQDFINKVKKQIVHNKKYLLTIIGVLLLTFVIVFSVKALRKGSSSRIQNMPDFLTAEEKEDWKKKEVDKEQIFVYINTDFTLKAGKKEVALRLVNPPYCAYPLKIIIINTEQSDKPLYESKMLQPGGSIEKANFINLPKNPGVYDLEIQYTYYDEKGDTIIGEHEVGAELEIIE